MPRRVVRRRGRRCRLRWAAGARGRSGSPSASTTAAWSIRNASALPRAMSERTASRTPRRSRSFRTFAGFSPMRSARRSISASSSSSVASISSCATTARSARSARTASVGPRADAVDELLLVLAGRGEVLRDRHPDRPAPRAGARGRAGGAPSPVDQRLGGVDRARARRRPRAPCPASTIWACTCAYRSRRCAHVVAQRLDGLELADLGDPLVGELGEHLLLASFTSTWKATSSPARSPKRSGSVSVNLRMSPGRLPRSSSSSFGHDDPRADLVEVVGGGEAVDRLVVDVALDVDLGVVAVDERRRPSPRGRRSARAAGRPAASTASSSTAGVVDLDPQRVVALDRRPAGAPRRRRRTRRRPPPRPR